MNIKRKNKKPLYQVISNSGKVIHGEKSCVGFDINGVCVWMRKKAFCCCARGFKT